MQAGCGRMRGARQFSRGTRAAMASAEPADRWRAAIGSSPYMQAAAQEAARKRSVCSALVMAPRMPMLNWRSSAMRSRTSLPSASSPYACSRTRT